MNHFTGTLSLMRFILKRDKISLLSWTLILPLLPLAAASAFAKLYPDAAALQAFVASIEANLVEIAMLGHVNAPTLGGLVAWRWTVQSVIFLGVFNLFFVIKHTRAEEATGRYELMSATAIGRYAILTATLCLAVCANFLIGAGISAGLIVYGLPVKGSVALGISAGLIGMLMTAVSALAAQLTREAGSARAIVGIFIVAIYFLKILADGGYENLTWLSPICWLHKIQAYGEENWAIAVLFVVSALLLVRISYILLEKREIGVGFLQIKDRRTPTSPYLQNSLALVWRLHRSMLFWWSLSFAILGGVCGALMKTIADQVGTNPQLQAYLQRIGGGDMSNFMFALMLNLFALMAASYSIMAVANLHAEEMEHRSDVVLSSSVHRLKWALQHLGMVFVGLVCILFALGASAGIFEGWVNHDIAKYFNLLLTACFAYLPALSVVAAVAFAIYSFFPARFSLSWVFLAFMVLMSFVKELSEDLAPLTHLSPLSHVPQTLMGQENVASYVWLSLVAVGLSGLGLLSYRKRDIL